MFWLFLSRKMEPMQAVRQLKGGEEICSSYIVRSFNVLFIICNILPNNSYIQSEMFFSSHVLLIMA